MSDIKSDILIKIIPIHIFSKCLEDNLLLEQICKLYTKKQIFINSNRPAYKLDKFIYHLKIKFNLTLKEYCNKYNIIEWPKCPIKKQDVGYKTSGIGIIFSKYKKGAIDIYSSNNQAAYKKMKIQRIGKNNPMYGSIAWNKGLSAETDERVKMIALKRRGKKVSNEIKEKQRLARKLHPLKARHTIAHSEETKNKCKISTARLWASGVFKRTTSIHLKMREFLNSIPLKMPYNEEYQVKWFSMDFAFPDIKLAIEVQGCYYHVDPRLYPNGPIDAIQRRNYGRDQAKRKICCDQEGWKIIEVWEQEINNGTFKDNLICKLKESGLLD